MKGKSPSFRACPGRRITCLEVVVAGVEKDASQIMRALAYFKCRNAAGPPKQCPKISTLLMMESFPLRNRLFVTVMGT